MTPATSPPTAALTESITGTIADLLGLTTDDVVAERTLFDLPGFDSVAIVSVLERLEDRWRVEVPADGIVPEAFETVDSLAGLLSVAGADGGRS
ncbi:acyl carrier protein [Amycolatopsis sp. NPDC089917]|uniref:acyl carrier protein n=1 Tax=Amycolatopsis sp. NPDC089917 TaxID=3155187 RepID=UPI0034351CE7